MPGIIIQRIGVALVISLASVQGAVAQAPRPAADAAERAADKEDKTVCKRFIETGSLIRGYRTCKPKREWERERENIRAPRVTSGSCSGQNGC